MEAEGRAVRRSRKASSRSSAGVRCSPACQVGTGLGDEVGRALSGGEALRARPGRVWGQRKAVCPQARHCLHWTHFFWVWPCWPHAEQWPGLWAGAIMIGGSPGRPCLVPLRAKMASAVAWSVTLTKAMEGLLADRLRVIAVMHAATMPKLRRKSPTLTGVQKSGMPVTARRISKSVTRAEALLVPQSWGSSAGDQDSDSLRPLALGAAVRPTVDQAPPAAVGGAAPGGA